MTADHTAVSFGLPLNECTCLNEIRAALRFPAPRRATPRCFSRSLFLFVVASLRDADPIVNSITVMLELESRKGLSHGRSGWATGFVQFLFRVDHTLASLFKFLGRGIHFLLFCLDLLLGFLYLRVVFR